jgi:prepilin signal peptidase PulO-like enzyme (type II secretory pathway)
MLADGGPDLVYPIEDPHRSPHPSYPGAAPAPPARLPACRSSAQPFELFIFYKMYWTRGRLAMCQAPHSGGLAASVTPAASADRAA